MVSVQDEEYRLTLLKENVQINFSVDGPTINEQYYSLPMKKALKKLGINISVDENLLAQNFKKNDANSLTIWETPFLVTETFKITSLFSEQIVKLIIQLNAAVYLDKKTKGFVFKKIK